MFNLLVALLVALVLQVLLTRLIAPIAIRSRDNVARRSATGPDDKLNRSPAGMT